MNRVRAVFPVFSLCLVLAIFVAMTKPLQASTKMPEFVLKNVQDNTVVKSSSFAGKVLYLVFFATWCPPCAQEVPILIDLQDKLADSGFSVVGLSVDQEGSSVVAGFAKKHAINYPVLMTEFKTTTDFGGIFGIPVAFLVNRAGNIVKKYTGYVQHEVLKKDIQSLLK